MVVKAASPGKSESMVTLGRALTNEGNVDEGLPPAGDFSVLGGDAGNTGILTACIK